MAEDMAQQVDAIFQPRAKVYCGDCFWYVPSRGTRHGFTVPGCWHAHARHTEETSEAVTIVHVPPEERNRQNDCADWRHRTFYSDLGQNPFKLGMVLFTVCVVLVWCWRMLRP